MKFYFSAQLVGVLMFVFMTILVAIGLTIGYGWHFVSETIDFVTLQSGDGLFNDTAKAVTITALLLPFLVGAYVAGRVANKAEYLNCIILGLILIGPFAWLYPPSNFQGALIYILPGSAVILGAIMSHWTRVGDAKRIARIQQASSEAIEE